VTLHVRPAIAQPIPADAGAPQAAEQPADAGAPSDAGPPPLGAAGDIEEPLPILTPTESELARGQPILEIAIAGNRRIARDDVVGYLEHVQVGKPFAPENLARDIRKLYESGFFEDIEAHITRLDNGLKLRLIVRERPNIKAIEFEGNKEIDTEDLTEALSNEVKTGTILNYAAIRRGVQKLRDKYAEEGYFLAEVSYELEPQRENEVILKLKIKEHEPVTVRRITFIGNHHIPDAELREVMITGTTSLFDFGSGGAFRQDAFERDILVISALYYDRGFLTVQVATPRVMLTPDRTGIEITLSITEGPRYRIRQLRIFERDADGREIEPLGGRRNLREMIRAKSGDYFNRAELVKDLGAVQTMYRDAGYANVEAPPETDLDPETREVDVIIAIRRHQPVYFGRIEIRGNTKTRDKVIRRELEIHEQELFSETKLEKSKRRVTALGFFERVDISTEQGSDPKYMDVNIEIGEKPTGTFQIGAGFSSLENFIATAQIQQANLFGFGQSLALQAQISGARQDINIRYFEPYLFDSPFSMSVSLYNQVWQYEQFSQSSIGGSLTLGYPIIDPELRLSLTYTLEDNQILPRTQSFFFGTGDQAKVYQQLPLANLFNDGLTSSLRPTIGYDTRNNQLFPTSGVFLQASAEYAPSFLGSQSQFVRYRATGRFYYPITESIVLKVNTEAGVIVSPDPQGVPIYARFHLGGITDIRGFQLRSIGPRLPLTKILDLNSPPIPYGANIGGNMMYSQNIEVEFPILDAVGIRGVVFTDLGNAWNLEPNYCRAAPASPYAVTNPCFSPEDIFNVRTSAGFGIRWFSPLGPLRFEWGFPFARLPYEETYKFEFTIGNFF
jgi:outer membrane protein insertion porin family